MSSGKSNSMFCKGIRIFTNAWKKNNFCWESWHETWRDFGDSRVRTGRPVMLRKDEAKFEPSSS